MLEGRGVGPFAERGLDETFGLSGGLGRMGVDPDLPDAKLVAGAGEGFRKIAAAIVGHDTLDGDAEAPEVSDRGEEEGDGAFFLLIREDVGTGDPGMVVDSDVSILPAGALTAAMAGAPAGDAMADAIEAAELLDFDVDDLARLLALVAWAWVLRLDAGENTEATGF